MGIKFDVKKKTWIAPYSKDSPNLSHKMLSNRLQEAGFGRQKMNQNRGYSGLKLAQLTSGNNEMQY